MIFVSFWSCLLSLSTLMCIWSWSSVGLVYCLCLLLFVYDLHLLLVLSIVFVYSYVYMVLVYSWSGLLSLSIIMCIWCLYTSWSCLLSLPTLNSYEYVVFCLLLCSLICLGRLAFLYLVLPSNKISLSRNKNVGF
jgi:hypothetical protein